MSNSYNSENENSDDQSVENEIIKEEALDDEKLSWGQMKCLHRKVGSISKKNSARNHDSRDMHWGRSQFHVRRARVGAT